MQSNKLDNQIREKLNAREIVPSAKSWDRLDAMLSVKEEKKPKKGFLWLYIAASFFVFFGLGIFLFNSDETLEVNHQIPVIVEVEKAIESDETTKTDKIVIESQQPVLVQNENKSVNKDNSIKDELIKKSSIASNITDHNQQQLTDNRQLIAKDSYKYVSPENLLAEVQNEEITSYSASKINPKSSVKVDANALLSTVEKELDVSYRETILDKLNKNFKVVKTAIVNRNYD
ncbi:hypothetical protein ACFSX9_14570 [Flavobacterium ardleyense]|uniref:Anti-sigma factor n=1 Tax=Flavobacterium ardleyense TaxID=2038737 RepID=A0ABW5ZBV6_9FLAO